MIRYTLSEKNVRPYMIGLGLIAAAILVSWLVIQNLPTISPPANVSLSVEAPRSTAVHPADRKFYTNESAISSGESRLVGPLSNVDPADRKFFTIGYAPGGLSGVIDPLANVRPADRKFYTNEYAISSVESRLVGPLANEDPADRKFFTIGYAADGLSGVIDPLANVRPADRKFFNNGYVSETP